MKTIIQIKNEVAQSKGYPSWNEMHNWLIDHNEIQDAVALLESAMNEVTERYSSQSLPPVSEEEIKNIKLVRNYFGEHDKTTFEHFAYGVLNNLLSRLPQREEHYMQVVKQTQEEEFAMYMQMDKEKIIEMLLECHRLMKAFKGEPLLDTPTITSTTYPEVEQPEEKKEVIKSCYTCIFLSQHQNSIPCNMCDDDYSEYQMIKP